MWVAERVHVQQLLWNKLQAESQVVLILLLEDPSLDSNISYFIFG